MTEAQQTTDNALAVSSSFVHASEGPRTRGYIEQLQAEFPDLDIVDKARSGFSKLLAVLVNLVTFGKVNNYISEVITTIGSTIYLPESWAAMTDESRYIVLRHEAVHLRQFRRYGMIGMVLLYLFPIFPIGLAWGRARLEWEAFDETIRATAEVYGLDFVRRKRFVRLIVHKFTKADYGWMWPFKRQVKRWVRRTIADVSKTLLEDNERSAGDLA